MTRLLGAGRATTVIAAVIVLVLLFPLHWIVNVSLMNQIDILRYPPPFIPPQLSLDGYRAAFAEAGTNVTSSLVYSVGTVIATMTIATPAAYALSRLTSRVTVAFLFVLLAQTIPGIVMANSLYALFAQAHWLTSYQVVILADTTIAVPFAIIVMRAFMLSIPRELFEAAVIDGAGPWRVFRSIVVPLSRNAVIAAALFAFLFGWGDYVRTLKVLGNWLAAEELARAAALRALRQPRVPDRLIEPVGDDAMRRLLAVASVRDRAILLLLLDTGLRVSEAGGLRLGDLRADGTLKVRGKGSKERIVPIGPTARQAIVRYLGQRGAGAADAPLFLGRRGPLDGRGIQQAIRRLKTRIGVTGRLSPHSLRHTFARSYLVNGGDVFSLQRILGHTTLDMVKRYVALAELEIVRRLHAIASPADRLLIGPKVSVILPRAVFCRLSAIGDRTRLTVEQLVGAAAERLAMSPPLVPGLGWGP